MFSGQSESRKPLCRLCFLACGGRDVDLPILLRKIAEDLVGGSNLGAVIEVGVDVAGRSDVAVAQPFLDVLEGYSE